MSPGRGSTPRRTDWQTASRNVTLTLTLMLVRFTVTLSTSEHLLYWQRHKPAPLVFASIAITRQPLPRSRLEYCSAARLRLGCNKRRTPFSGPQFLPTASQLAATQRAPPGVEPAARPDKKKNARSTFSGPRFLPTCYESYVVVAVNTDIPQCE
jgi:hypothetical protein